MATLGRIIEDRGGAVATVDVHETVFAALQLMAERDIGALPVVSEGEVVGLFTERDYARKGILRDRSSKETCVSEMMADAVLVRPDCSLEEGMRLLIGSRPRVRYLVVNDAGGLRGVVSIADLMRLQLSSQQESIEALGRYITG